MNLKCNLNGLRYIPPSKLGEGACFNSCIAKTSRSFFKMCKFFDIYETGRESSYPILFMLDDAVSAFFRKCKVRYFENDKGKMLAGYSYKLRKNHLGEKSMYIDGLARDFKDCSSKKIMSKVYEDIKQTAKDKEVKEITLFSYASDKYLRHNYEKLGFKTDERCIVDKLYLMRVRVEDFINNKCFQIRKYKEAVGLDSILRTK